MASSSGIVVQVIKNDLGRMATRLVSKTADSSEDTADAIVVDAQIRAPERSGDLKRGIRKRRDGIGFVVEATEPYSARIEYGFNGADALGRVYHQAAQPYLTPAAEAQRAPYLDRLKRALGNL